MALSPATTVYDLLDSYPFLGAFLEAYHPVFARLADTDQRHTWARMVTLAEVATVMNLPWRLFLRDLETEVTRATGTAPAIASLSLGADAEDAKGDEVWALVGELERGAPLADVARRMQAATGGLDDGQVAALARRRHRRDELAAEGAVLASVSPAAHSLGPGHPVSALRRECERFAQLAGHVEETVERLPERPSGAQRQTFDSLRALLDRLDEVAVQRKRLERAWFPTLASRGGRGPSALIRERLMDVLRLGERLRAALERADAAAVKETSPRYLEALRRALAGEEDLLVPLSVRVLDREDWEALGEQERAVGWALQGG